MTEEKMAEVGWHHQLAGHEFEQTLGDSERQGSLARCSPWGRKESDTTQQLNNEHAGSHLCFSKKISIHQKKKFKIHGVNLPKEGGINPQCSICPQRDKQAIFTAVLKKQQLFSQEYRILECVKDSNCLFCFVFDYTWDSVCESI